MNQLNIDEYLQSDDSSSEEASDADATLEISDDDEKDFEAHTKPKFNFEGAYEDNMSSNSSEDSEKPSDSKLNLYKKFIKQNIKIVMIAYNRK